MARVWLHRWSVDTEINTCIYKSRLLHWHRLDSCISVVLKASFTIADLDMWQASCS
jgi:hypothetical protein